MASTDKIKAGVERIQDGEKIGATTRISQPVTKLLDVAVIETNVKLARKVESQITDALAKRDKAIDKARSGPTLHPELVKQLKKNAEAHANEELDALLAKLTENAGLLAQASTNAARHGKVSCSARNSPALATATLQRVWQSRLNYSRLSASALVEAARSAVADF